MGQKGGGMEPRKGPEGVSQAAVFAGPHAVPYYRRDTLTGSRALLGGIEAEILVCPEGVHKIGAESPVSGALKKSAGNAPKTGGKKFLKKTLKNRSAFHPSAV
jgi:hypothetical protein